MSIIGNLQSIVDPKSKNVDVVDRLSKALGVFKNDNEGSISDDIFVSKSINGALDFIKPADKNKQDKEINDIFKNIKIDNDRKLRYDDYDVIYKTVPLIQTIIQIYIDNVFIKDTLSQKLFKVTNITSDNIIETNINSFTNELVAYFNLEKNIKTKIGNYVFKYGDAFIEIVDVNKEKINYNTINNDDILNENKYFTHNINKDEDIYYENCFILENNTTDKNIIVNNKKNKSTRFGNITLKYHKPHNVIPLITKDDTHLGFLYININKTGNNTDQNKFNLISQINSSLSKMNNSNTNSMSSEFDNELSKFNTYLIKKIFTQYEIIKTDKMSDDDFEDLVKNKLSDDLLNTIKKLLLEQSNKDNKIKLGVRYIPTNRMVHFSSPNSDFHPFGNSIIEKFVIPGKLYTLAVASNALIQLSRAAVIRNWTLELGSSTDTSKMREEFKKDLKNTTISIQDIYGYTGKPISQLLTNFVDMIQFTRKGQKYVSMETLNLGDPNVSTRNIEDLRQEIVGMSGIPPAQLGINVPDNYTEQVVSSNINFAVAVSSYQQSFNTSLMELFDEIAEITQAFSYRPSEYIKITLNPPYILNLRQIESYVTSIGNISTALANINFPFDPKDFLNKYIPFENWEDIYRKGMLYKKENPPQTQQ